MSDSESKLSAVFRLSPQINLVPVIHGSGDFAFEIRRLMLQHSFDCLAVPLPASFQENVEQAIEWLPTPLMVADAPAVTYGSDWRPENDLDDDDDSQQSDQIVSFVPIDPCQPVIAAIRSAVGERIPRAFIDLETDPFLPYSRSLPDPFALKTVAADVFATAVLPAVPPLPHEQARERVRHMAKRLRELESHHESILAVVSILDWPWIRDAYRELSSQPSDTMPTLEEADPADTVIYRPSPDTLIFLLGELPYITELYERARSELSDDERLSVDGIKELLITARHAYRADFRGKSRKISPHTLSSILKYVRNLTLMDRRLTPDLYNLVIAAKQIAGDSYALHVAEVAGSYDIPFHGGFDEVTLGIDKMRLPNGTVVHRVSRLPGQPMQWRRCDLLPRPDKDKQRDWEMKWNPMSQCSWPPEDEKIENFREHVAEKAKAIMGVDLAKTEKFTTSLKDGLDIRDTLRNWHTGDLYVKVLSPSRGRLDCVVMLFDSPADPRDYPWRTTWFAENQNESTLCFFASDYRDNIVGPQIAQATYGGAMFLFPPRPVRNIWDDPRLDFVNTMEERLLAAACLHADCPHIALMSPLSPGPAWRRLAKRYKKKWVHVPLSSFGQSTLAQLRMVHVLNGHQVRSYAADFIRRA